MTIWRFSDGTVAHLGGEVEGASLFAQQLREVLGQPDLQMELGPSPGPLVAVDLSNPSVFDHLLTVFTLAPSYAGAVSITERPRGIPPLELPPAVPVEPGIVY
jgi:hypothetical protein